MRRNLSEHDARRLLVAGPLALVTTTWRGNSDVAPVAWTMPLSADPPFVGVAVHPSRHTHDMMRFSEEFALNFPAPGLLNFAQYFGTTSGRDVDKFDASKLPTFNARKIDAKLLDGCVAWIECGVEDVLRIGDHSLFVGRVVAVSAEDEAYNETWTLQGDDRPLHYLGGSSYATLGQRLEARAPEPEAATEAAREDEERREEADYERRRRGEDEGG